MKRTIVFAIAGLLATALSSCDTADPVSSPQVSEDASLNKASCGGTIVLGENIPLGVLDTNPLSSDQSAFIVGKVLYGVGPSPVLQRDMVSVSLELDAELHPQNWTDQIWLFSGKSTDLVAISNAGPTFLHKAYRRPGQAITLYVQFEVTTCQVKVNQMWAVRDGRSTALPTDS